MAQPRAVTVVMPKGGTTKSTVTGNTAEALGRKDQETLVIDLDPNGHLTRYLGYDEIYQKDNENIGHVITDAFLTDAEPEDIIIDTGLGFDLVPSDNKLEKVGKNLNTMNRGMFMLKEELVDPLLGEEYDYILIDTHSSRNILLDIATYAAPEFIVPMVADKGIDHGLNVIQNRIMGDLSEQGVNVRILSFAPNKISERMDQRTGDYEMLETIIQNKALRQKVPNFAFIPPEDLKALVNGGYDGPVPKPGIRKYKPITKAWDEDLTLGEYTADDNQTANDQLSCFDELAEIVMQGGVERDA